MLEVGTGSFVTLNRTPAGRFRVVSVVMHILTTPDSPRRRYALGLQRDLTNIITIEEVIKIALHGGDSAVEQHLEFLMSCEKLFKRRDAMEFLHRTMEGIWESQVGDPSVGIVSVGELQGLTGIDFAFAPMVGESVDSSPRLLGSESTMDTPVKCPRFKPHKMWTN